MVLGSLSEWWTESEERLRSKEHTSSWWNINIRCGSATCVARTGCRHERFKRWQWEHKKSGRLKTMGHKGVLNERLRSPFPHYSTVQLLVPKLTRCKAKQSRWLVRDASCAFLPTRPVPHLPMLPATKARHGKVAGAPVSSLLPSRNGD